MCEGYFRCCWLLHSAGCEHTSNCLHDKVTPWRRGWQQAALVINLFKLLKGKHKLLLLVFTGSEVKCRWASAPWWLKPLRQDCLSKGWKEAEPTALGFALMGGAAALLPQRGRAGHRRWLELPIVASGRPVCLSQGAVVAHYQPGRAWTRSGEVWPGMVARKKWALLLPVLHLC